MTVQPDDVFATLKQIRKDLTVCQVRVTDALNQLGQLNLPSKDVAICDQCGTRLRGPLSLAEHVHVSHGGPLPDHWLEAERKAGLAS